MLKLQTLRALVNERLTATAEDIFVLFEGWMMQYEEELCRYKQENQRQQQLLNRINTNQRTTVVRGNFQIPSSNPSPGVVQEIPGSPGNEEEPEEQTFVKQEEEQLPVCVPESSAVCMKTEGPSLLQQRQKKQREETQGEDMSSETEADGDHDNQVQNKPAPESVHSQHMSASDDKKKKQYFPSQTELPPPSTSSTDPAHALDLSVFDKDVPENTMMALLFVEMKQMSHKFQSLAAAVSSGSDLDSDRDLPVVLPLISEEHFNILEAALRDYTVRQKMISRLSMVGGANTNQVIRRMFSATLSNNLASRFNWKGTGPKRAFKDTLVHDSMFAAARLIDGQVSELSFNNVAKKWLQYAPDRKDGIKRKSDDRTSDTYMDLDEDPDAPHTKRRTLTPPDGSTDDADLSDINNGKESDCHYTGEDYPYLTDLQTPGTSSVGSTHALDLSVFDKDMPGNNMMMLLVEMKQMSNNIQSLTAAVSTGPTDLDSDRDLPVALPLISEEHFDLLESALRDYTIRQKMISRLSTVGGANTAQMIRRMLSSTLANNLACRFSWRGTGPKRPFKETLVQDCIFAAARVFDGDVSELSFSDVVKKWLRYAPDRKDGIKRKISIGSLNTDMATMHSDLSAFPLGQGVDPSSSSCFPFHSTPTSSSFL